MSTTAGKPDEVPTDSALKPVPGGRSLAQAVVTALVLLGLIAVFYIMGRDAFAVLVAAVVLLSLYELLVAVVHAGHRPVVPLGLLGGAGMLLVAQLEEPQLLGAVAGGTVLGALLLALRPGRGASPSSDAAWTVFGVAWIGGGGAGAVSILRLEGGVDLLVAVVLITALDDIGAYFVGVNFGRHKMAPSISPAKSWEGFFGGALTALAGGLVFAALLDQLELLDGLALGAIAAIFAPVGDLVESLAKRELGIKDSGSILPGHGGILDRLDAILLCCPLAYLYLRFVVF